MPIAKSCEFIEKQYPPLAGSEWYCTYYQKAIGNCGDDCPQYKYNQFKELWNKEEEVIEEPEWTEDMNWEAIEEKYW